MAYLNTTASSQSFVLARITAAIATLDAALKRRKLYRETYAELEALTDRELEDLGLSRYDLHTVAATASQDAVR
ncbi:MAG: DUF1127 domain-containing protein [Sulfitobacter sp.]